MSRKIEAMHARYGRAQNPAARCSGCCNFRRYEYRDRTYFKCAAYGESHSAATDWRAKWPACGMAGVPFEDMGERPWIHALIGTPIEPDWVPLPGQIEMEGIK